MLRPACASEREVELELELELELKFELEPGEALRLERAASLARSAARV